ncbi:MAG: 1-acyl-sn-glycerol-3-phosphate acyltransferase [Solirubrobacteraceae bacterium]|nr:1-acyl-sn-glycerol-3-phosphate acyltransferase [Solirubrobacteraceae bacterium]
MSAKQAERPEGDDGLVKLKEQVYVDPRPSEYFDRFYAYTRSHPNPGWVYTTVRVITVVMSRAFFRIRGIDAQNVPASGPVIIAPNHFSHIDHFFAGASLRRKLQFMAKSQLFVPPLQGIYMRGGTFPVRRGNRDSRAMDISREILERGGAMVMYCEGGRSRSGELQEKAKWGIGRIALETGAPIVPTAILGSSHVRNFKKGEFPTVTVKYGKPLRFEKVEDPTREQSQAAADQIFDEIKTLYYGLRDQGRGPALAAARASLRRG